MLRCYPVVAENATMENAVEIAKNAGFVKANDTAVVVAGVPANEGNTNIVKVEVVK